MRKLLIYVSVMRKDGAGNGIRMYARNIIEEGIASTNLVWGRV